MTGIKNQVLSIKGILLSSFVFLFLFILHNSLFIIHPVYALCTSGPCNCFGNDPSSVSNPCAAVQRCGQWTYDTLESNMCEGNKWIIRTHSSVNNCCQGSIECGAQNSQCTTYAYPTPAYAYPTPAYAYPTPTYAYPTPGYAYPTPAYAYPTPTYAYPTPAYAYPTPAYTYPTPAYGTPTTPGGGLIQNIFGKIRPPRELEPFTRDKTGVGGLSLFLSNLIKLIYAVAAVVLVFMLVWGAWEWLVSGGDKEKIANARSRIIHAIIGIMLFAIAFAVIGVLGQFTGFKFFEGQGGGSGPYCSQRTCIYNQGGTCYRGNCTNNSENCSDAVDCGYVAGCPGGGTPVTCPSSGGSPSILNCSYSEPSARCSSGFQVCTGHTTQPSCFNSAPRDCFNPVVGCNFLADGSSTCTCSP